MAHLKPLEAIATLSFLSDDIKSLFRAAKDHGIRLLMDFVPNHILILSSVRGKDCKDCKDESPCADPVQCIH